MADLQAGGSALSDTDRSDIRTGLGLGDSATRNVGTTAGTVAAGDDTRLSDSREWTAATVDQAEAEAGTATTRRAWTALRVRQAIAAWWQSASSTVGRAVVTAADAAAGRTAIGAQRDGYVGPVAVTGTPTAGQVPIASSGTAAAWGAVTAAPAGSGGDIQYNAAGSFGAATGLTYNSATRQIALTGGVLTSAGPLWSIAGTWNNAAATMGGLTLNVTDTASAAASLLLDLQVGGASRVLVTKAGVLTVRGTGGSAGMSGDASYRGAFLRYEGSDCLIYSTTRLTVRAGAGIGWSSSGSFPELDPDTGLHRNAAGVVEINNGTAGQYRDLRLRNVRTNATTVAGLVAAGTAGAGARGFVTDANSATFGAAAAGGGANAMPVWCDGTGWFIG